nr:49K [Calliteara abietis nucleopolyhedrovirus]
MSVLEQKLSIDVKDFKYLFVSSYFYVLDHTFAHYSIESRPFIAQYLRNRFDLLDDACLFKYLQYLNEIKLRNIITDKSTDIFKYIKPQFKFTCHQSNFNILRFDDKVYVQPGTPIYATNFFVKEPGKFRIMMYREFSKVYEDRNFVSNSDFHCLLNGNEGYIFESAYLDWCGIRMCHETETAFKPSFYHYRLYLVGEHMTKHFVNKNILFTNVSDFELKNFYKGIVLFANNLKISNSKKFATRKPNQLFDELRAELATHSAYVKFIQRDYIYDADFPEDLLDLLNNYMTETSVYKFISKFDDAAESAERFTPHNEIVVDRYAINRYRKLNVKIDSNNRFPSLRYKDPSFLMTRQDMIQIKGTLNAFYVPKMKLLAILSNNSLFGSTETLEFTTALIPYISNSPPKRLQQDSYVIDKSQHIYLTKIVFGDAVPAYLLIRGDYESSFKSLEELKNTWVQNTLLKLFITPELIKRSLEISNYNLSVA